jgi:hypothetical protein
MSKEQLAGMSHRTNKNARVKDAGVYSGSFLPRLVGNVRPALDARRVSRLAARPTLVTEASWLARRGP